MGKFTQAAQDIPLIASRLEEYFGAQNENTYKALLTQLYQTFEPLCRNLPKDPETFMREWSKEI